MQIPQIKSTLKICVVIFVLAVCGGIYQARSHGELNDFAMLMEVMKDSAVSGIGAVAGWIFFKSPWARHGLEDLSADELKDLLAKKSQE